MRSARKAAKMSQEELGRALNLPQHFISAIEMGKRPLPKGRIPQLPKPIRDAVIAAAIAELEAAG